MLSPLCFSSSVKLTQKVVPNFQVNIGLQKDCCIDKKLTPGVRVTVKLHKGLESNCKQIRTEVVSPSEPREKRGLYWGYAVRLADSLSTVFSQCPYTGGYDLTVGTSERGQVVDDCQVQLPPSEYRTNPVFKGLKVVWGQSYKDFYT